MHAVGLLPMSVSFLLNGVEVGNRWTPAKTNQHTHRCHKCGCYVYCFWNPCPFPADLYEWDGYSCIRDEIRDRWAARGLEEVLDEVERELDGDLELPDDHPDVVLDEGFGSVPEHSEPVPDEPVVDTTAAVEASNQLDERANLKGEHIDNILQNIQIPEKPPLVEQGELTKEEYASVWEAEKGVLVKDIREKSIAEFGPEEGKRVAANLILERVHRMKYLMAVIKVKWKSNHAMLETLLQQLDADVSAKIRQRDKELGKRRQSLSSGDASGGETKTTARRKPPVDKREKAIQSLMLAGMSREAAEAMLGAEPKV